jgi:hypothetical protein
VLLDDQLMLCVGVNNAADPCETVKTPPFSADGVRARSSWPNCMAGWQDSMHSHRERIHARELDC